MEPEFFSKAISELNEPNNNEERLAAIDFLRNQFKAQNPQIQLEREDDFFILQFLRAEEFQTSKALDILQNYHTKMPLQHDVFEEVKSSMLLERMFDSGVVCPLEGKAKNGSAVLVTRLGLHHRTLSDVLCVLFLTIRNLLLADENNQTHGFSIIHDMKFFNNKVASQVKPILYKPMLNTLTKCLPVRIKTFSLVFSFFTNEPFLFNASFSLIHMFMDKKIKSKVQKLGTNFSEIYKIIDETVLPKFLGGTRPDLILLCGSKRF